MSFVRQRKDVPGSQTQTLLVSETASDLLSPNSAAAQGPLYRTSSSASRPGSASRPNSSSRPGSGSRPNVTRQHPLAQLMMADTVVSENDSGEYEMKVNYHSAEHQPASSGSAYRMGSASRGSGNASSASAKRGFAADVDILDSTVVEDSASVTDEKEASAAMADDWPSVLADGWRAYWLRTLHDIFLTSWLNLLLLCIPVSVIVFFVGAPAPVIFIFSLLSLCPLAERIAFITDELAKYTNDTFGGLISASMGNVTELIVAIVAISEGGNLLVVTQLSLVGSVISNLLLVLGCAFLAGGYKHPNQRYSKPAVNANVGLLVLATMTIMLPTILTVSRGYNWFGITSYPSYYNVNEPNMPDTHALNLSRAIAVLMFILYCFLVYYQLFTHRSLFEAQEDEDEEETPPVLGLWGAVGWACAITVLIAILSEFIVSSIEDAASASGIPIMFVSTIILPIVGNAAEHTSAIIFAYRNKMDISLGIAVGSATQISLFVIPLCVLIAAMAGQPLSMDFGTFHAAVLFFAVLVTVVSIQTGTSDWMKGALLVFAYLVLSACYWVIDTPAALVNKDSEPDLTDPALYTPRAPLGSSTGLA